MSGYEQYVARHGECGVQSIIEQIERTEGIVPRQYVQLKQRWDALMQQPPSPGRDAPASRKFVA